jgi:hypothetical protein
MKKLVTLGLALVCHFAVAQSEETAKIEVLYGGYFSKSEDKYPGASIFERDESGPVQFRHKGALLDCDIAYLYADENRLEAYGNIVFNQGDTLILNSKELIYSGITRLAEARQKVRLTSPTSTLTTETLYFDRKNQEAYYPSFGTLVDEENTLKSNKGRYLIEQSLYRFEESVTLENEKFNLISDRLDYHTEDEVADFFGPTTITGEDYTFYFEQGSYDTKNERGYGKTNTKINYDLRKLFGDSIYFNQFENYAAASGQVKVLDSINESRLSAEFAEIFKAKDSLVATGEAIIAKRVESDSLYVHASYLFVTGPDKARNLFAYPNARFFKTDFSGKSDSIVVTNEKGITELIGNPIIWSGESQLTGNYIYFTNTPETNALDSLYVIENAFIATLDTIAQIGYNQAKGVNLQGKFLSNGLESAVLDKNAEVIYYLYDDKGALIGINQTTCSAIRLNFEEGEISRITFLRNPNGTLYPYTDFPEDQKLLEGFQWFGEERARDLESFIEKIKGLKK